MHADRTAIWASLYRPSVVRLVSLSIWFFAFSLGRAIATKTFLRILAPFKRPIGRLHVAVLS